MAQADATLLETSGEVIGEGLEALGDIWRHEGLKDLVGHGLDVAGRSAAGRWVLERIARSDYDDPLLHTEVAGLPLDGPVGIAPGWDKNGIAILGWQALGAHHITVGGVKLEPEGGQKRPRLWTMDEQLGDHGKRVSLNHYGFPSQGAPQVRDNIWQQRDSAEVTIPVIAQVTPNKELYDGRLDEIPEALADTIRILLPVVDGIELGLSSPNTDHMRGAQKLEFLRGCLVAARDAMPADMPLGYKGDGDGGPSRLNTYCELTDTPGLLNYLGLINSTTLLHLKQKYGAEHKPGGLAGADPGFQDLAIQSVRYVYEQVGDKIVIIGMGGINNRDRAYDMLRAGASAIGINTAVRQLGARAVTSIERGLVSLLNAQPNIEKLDDVIGAATSRGPKANLTTG